MKTETGASSKPVQPVSNGNSQAATATAESDDREDDGSFNVDDILKVLGPFKKFNIMIWLCMGYGNLFCTAAIVSYSLLAAIPKYR